MTQRTNKHIEKLLKSVDKLWQLNLNEEELLETVFNLILAGKTKETADVLDFYTSEEWGNLLHRIPEIEIKDFAEAYLDMVEEYDTEDCITLKEYDDEDLLDECDRRCLYVDEERSKLDIVTQSQLDELVSNFLSADFEKRNKFLEL